MTGNASFQQQQQLGVVDAMMAGSFFFSGGGGGAADTALFHDGSSFVFGEPADVNASFPVDGGSMLAGQLQETARGTWDVTVAHHAPKAVAAKLAGEMEMEGGWIHEPYFYGPTWLSGAVNVTPAPDQSSEVRCSGVTHASSGAAAAAGVFRQPPPCGGGEMAARHAGPRLHFSQVLSRWPLYAHVTQQTLDEFVGCLLQDVAGLAFSAGGGGGGGEVSSQLPSSSCSKTTTTTSSNPSVFLGAEEHAHQKLKNDLQKLLQLLDQRCNQCMDEIQGAASKYGGMVRPGGGGALLSPFAHGAVSAMHRRLRARITGEIAAATRRGGEPSPPSSSMSLALADRERSWESAFIQKHWALRQLRRGDQQSWRPQRGLPEKSVAVLKAWMFENFLRPYPKDSEKEMLAARSGLSRSQVSNWFINARVRLWKPMIEEMYEDLKKASGGGDGGAA